MLQPTSSPQNFNMVIEGDQPVNKFQLALKHYFSLNRVNFHFILEKSTPASILGLQQYFRDHGTDKKPKSTYLEVIEHEDPFSHQFASCVREVPPWLRVATCDLLGYGTAELQIQIEAFRLPLLFLDKIKQIRGFCF